MNKPVFCAQTAAAADVPPVKIAAFGDSLSAGYGMA
ncbi:MAG: arylesterase, partial [Betaproteobacteria bacterium]|nr:arylesterase [Betaproteobacteria bacterium]